MTKLRVTSLDDSVGHETSNNSLNVKHAQIVSYLSFERRQIWIILAIYLALFATIDEIRVETITQIRLRFQQDQQQVHRYIATTRFQKLCTPYQVVQVRSHLIRTQRFTDQCVIHRHHYMSLIQVTIKFLCRKFNVQQPIAK
jgi:hypothetical protein